MERNQDIWGLLADLKHLTKGTALHFFFSTLTPEEGSPGPLSPFLQLSSGPKDTTFPNTAQNSR